ncbi:hypothetical protein EC396_07230 [Lutibacter sp. HS1-25]|uniref:hypothetical protein n=1 Tax=Lutibacter sp. HS1-25 TaxID=2485000 RepID=UPI00101317EA|nr:hypothetical protein [Lutibacter sp. HS1-25]RXP57094.1 hypothetical protein EC396_07230 [Lutibacter sp. HS1-25]
MNKSQLLQTCNQLKQVSETAAMEYASKANKLVSEMNVLMLARPDIEALVGKENLAMMQDNHSNHIRFITSILKDFNSEVLVETILWVFRAYRSRGFSTNYWAAQLNTWVQLIECELTVASYNEVLPLYEWMQVNIPIFVKLSDEMLESPNN